MRARGVRIEQESRGEPEGSYEGYGALFLTGGEGVGEGSTGLGLNKRIGVAGGYEGGLIRAESLRRYGGTSL